MKNLLFLFSLLTIMSCKNPDKQKSSSENVLLSDPDTAREKDLDSPQAVFAKNIEEAHNIEEFKKHKAVSFNIVLSFGDNNQMNAKITSLTNSSKIRIDKKDGTLLIYNGKDAYICPANADDKGARFDMFTWQYFFFLPFKLTDPGTRWQEMGPQKTEGTIFNTGKLTFNSNTGDTPNDWYIVYQDPESGFLHAAAYIVTFGSDKEKAAQNPHAIVYKDYKVVNGVPFATTWEFHRWSKENGIGDKIGEAKISDIVLFPGKDNLFEKPENSKVIEQVN